MGDPAEIILRGLQGGKIGPADQAALTDFFKRLSDSAASANAVATLGATGGAKIRRLVVDGDLAVPAGNITVGPVAPTKGNVLINSDGIKLRSYTTNKISLSTAGDVMIGADLSQPGSTYISIFSIQQNYNGENFLAGDMLIGDNSANKANMKWDKAAGILNFRHGSSTTIFINTDGSQVFMNNTRLNWRNAANSAAAAFITYDTGNGFSIVNANPSTEISLQVTMTDLSQIAIDFQEDGALANRTQQIINAGANGAKLSLAGTTETYIEVAGSGGGTTLAHFTGDMDIKGGLNLGTATGAGAGQIRQSDSSYYPNNFGINWADSAGTYYALFNLGGTNNMNIGGAGGAAAAYGTVSGGGMFFYLGAANQPYRWRNSSSADLMTLTDVGSTKANLALTGKITSYNGVSTAGNGVAPVVATVDLTAQAASISTTTLYAVPASNGGLYLVSWYAHITQASVTTSQLGELTIAFTDNTDSSSRTSFGAQMTEAGTVVTKSTANTTNVVLAGVMPIWAKASTNITYALTYANTGSPGMQYELHMKLEFLG